MTCIAVVTTVGSRTEAQTLARTLVERELAACAHISEVESFYHWQGKVRNEVEYRVIFKTVAERYADLEEAIRALHSYELPAIYAWPLEPVYEPYARWIEAHSAGR